MNQSSLVQWRAWTGQRWRRSRRSTTTCAGRSTSTCARRGCRSPARRPRRRSASPASSRRSTSTSWSTWACCAPASGRPSDRRVGRAPALRAGRGGHRGARPGAEPRAAGLDPGRGRAPPSAATSAPRTPRCGSRGERGAALGAAERARLRGGRVGAERALATSEELLARQGFEPFREDGSVRLRNCPFHPLAGHGAGAGLRAEPRLPRRVVDGLDAADRVAAELAPRPGECCVELRPGLGGCCGREPRRRPAPRR